MAKMETQNENAGKCGTLKPRYLMILAFMEKCGDGNMVY